MKNFIELNELNYFTPIAGFKAKMVHSEHQTIAFWEIDAGAVLPEHQHPHEQFSILTKGVLELNIEGEIKIMKQGMLARIPAHAKHSAKAITACEVTDIFYPVREDYLSANQS